MITTASIMARILLELSLANLNQNVVSSSLNTLSRQLLVIAINFNDVCVNNSSLRSYAQEINLNLSNFTNDPNNQYSIYNTADNVNTMGMVEITNIQYLWGGNTLLTAADSSINFMNVEDFYAMSKVSIQSGTFPSVAAFDPLTRCLLLAPPLNTSIVSGMVIRGIYGVPAVTVQYSPTVRRPMYQNNGTLESAVIPSPFTFTPATLNLPNESAFINFLIKEVAYRSAHQLGIDISPTVKEQRDRYRNSLASVKADQAHSTYLSQRNQSLCSRTAIGCNGNTLANVLLQYRSGKGIFYP